MLSCFHGCELGHHSNFEACGTSSRGINTIVAEKVDLRSEPGGTKGVMYPHTAAEMIAPTA